MYVSVVIEKLLRDVILEEIAIQKETLEWVNECATGTVRCMCIVFCCNRVKRRRYALMSMRLCVFVCVFVCVCRISAGGWCESE
jgi:hypothetical protein